MIKMVFAAVAGTILVAIAPGFAEPAGRDDDVEFVFIETDTNGSGAIDKSEILVDVLADFQAADTNSDGYIEKQEAGDQAGVSEFTDGDTDKDGKISVEESISEKIADFKAADADSSGTLTIEEVRKTVSSGD